jgi:beta-galactosamide-alpha-2,3-sialyltransferase
LQARICQAILRERPPPAFDLLYVTQDDNELDRSYYARLASHASASEYVHIPRRRPDILNHLIGIWRARASRLLTGHDEIYLGSIDSFIFRYVLAKNPSAAVYGFDDGTGNFTFASVYHARRHARARLYAAVLRLPSTEAVKQRIRHHFSIYPGLANIVSSDRVSYLAVFDTKTHAASAERMRFFIGQPFSEYLPPPQVERLKAWLRTQELDAYVMHPREKEPLLPDLPVLDKRGELAEDAILAAARGKRPVITAVFSTVLFNISSRTADKIYLSLGTGATEMELRRLAQEAGASVVTLAGNHGGPAVGVAR